MQKAIVGTMFLALALVLALAIFFTVRAHNESQQQGLPSTTESSLAF